MVRIRRTVQSEQELISSSVKNEAFRSQPHSTRASRRISFPQPLFKRRKSSTSPHLSSCANLISLIRARVPFNSDLYSILDLLKQFEPVLRTRLDQIDIPPQIYGLRWLRVLFSREFSLENTLTLWDMIFSDSPTLEFADYICVAMLCFIRSDCEFYR